MSIKYTEETIETTANKNKDNFVAVVIDSSSNYTQRRVIYHEPGVGDIKTFADFNEYIQTEFSADIPVINEDSKFESFYISNRVVENIDVDEDAQKESKVYTVEAVYIEFFKGFEWENLTEVVKKAEKNLMEKNEDVLVEYKEAAEEIKDPYRSRGLSRSDFF